MAWVKHKENRILNLNRITDIGVGQLYNSNGKLEWFIIFRDNNENQCTSRPYISKEECEKDFNYLIESLNNGMSYIDLTNVQQNRIQMTGKYLLDKGFTKQFDETTALTYFYSPDKKISVWLQSPKSSSSYCSVYVVDSNNSFRGSLEFTYVNEFEEFLKLCGISYGEK